MTSPNTEHADTDIGIMMTRDAQQKHHRRPWEWCTLRTDRYKGQVDMPVKVGLCSMLGALALWPPREMGLHVPLVIGVHEESCD